jgi:hypothetical protein
VHTSACFNFLTLSLLWTGQLYYIEEQGINVVHNIQRAVQIDKHIADRHIFFMEMVKEEGLVKVLFWLKFTNLLKLTQLLNTSKFYIWNTLTFFSVICMSFNIKMSFSEYVLECLNRHAVGSHVCDLLGMCIFSDGYDC